MLTKPKVRCSVCRCVGVSVVVWSKLSCPFIMSNINFASSDVCVSGPIQSKDIVISINPYLDIAP